MVELKTVWQTIVKNKRLPAADWQDSFCGNALAGRKFPA
jgi:hypothetical protein